MEKYHAIVLGASGLVGSYLLQLLLQHDDFISVTIPVRRSLGIRHPKLMEVITDFEDLEALEIPGQADVLFSCLGTTKAKTPELEAYEKIEIDIPRAMIRKQAQLNQVHLISAIGVNPGSGNFYIRIKYKAEQSVIEKHIEKTYIYRPSLITGDRKEKRVMEKMFTGIFSVLNTLLIGSLRKYRSVPAATIARQMLDNALHARKGVHYIYFDGKD